MNGSKEVNTEHIAVLQVWGKGYRVSADSEEFQRFVPLESPRASTLEGKLETLPWGKVLEPLYPMSKRELGNQWCLLFDSSNLLSVSFAPTEDRHQRPSLLLTSALTAIVWSANDIADKASRLVSLSSRLAGAYANTMKGSPEAVGRQLTMNGFLPSRTFDLRDETPSPISEWDRIVSAVKKWQGITGICTPRLLALGANVLLGTKFEADRAQQQFRLDGYLDLRDGDISPLTDQLTPWKSAPSVTPSSVTTAASEGSDFAPIVDSLNRMEHTMDRLADGIFQFLEQLLKDKRKK